MHRLVLLPKFVLDRMRSLKLKVNEIKLKIDGSKMTFSNNVVAYVPQKYIVVKYVATKEDARTFNIPVNSYSWGVWELEHNSFWGAYRTHQCNGNLINYRFDCVESAVVRPAIDTNSLDLCIKDLILDTKVFHKSDGSLKVIFEDEDEVHFHRSRLSNNQIKIIDKFRQSFLEEPHELINKVDKYIKTVAFDS